MVNVLVVNNLASLEGALRRAKKTLQAAQAANFKTVAPEWMSRPRTSAGMYADPAEYAAFYYRSEYAAVMDEIKGLKASVPTKLAKIKRLEHKIKALCIEHKIGNWFLM